MVKSLAILLKKIRRESFLKLKNLLESVIQMQLLGLVATSLYYDPSFSGTKALSDGFGNQTRAFIVTDNSNDGTYEVNPK